MHACNSKEHDDLRRGNIRHTPVEVAQSCHDDVIKWKHFPRYWPFLRGIHRSPVNSPHKGQRSFDIFFDLHPNKRLSKQWWGWWFETQSCSRWRHRNACNLGLYSISGGATYRKVSQSIYITGLISLRKAAQLCYLNLNLVTPRDLTIMIKTA